MTIRLSTLFEEHIKQVIYNWKAARRRADKEKKKAKNSPQDRNKPGPSNRSGPSTRAATSNGNVRKPPPSLDDDSTNSSDDDDDDDDGKIDRKRSKGSGRVRRRNARAGKRNIANGVTSTMSTSTEPIPGPSGRNLRRNTSRPNSQEEEEEEDDDDTSTESTTNSSAASSHSSSSSSSSSEDDSEESHGIPVTELGKARKATARHNRDNDSEDSYKPINEKRTTNKAKKRKNPSRNKRSAGNKAKRSKFALSDDKENKKSNVNNRRGNYRRKKGSSNDDDDNDDEIDVGIDDIGQQNDSSDGAESNYSDDNKPKRGRPPGSSTRVQSKLERNTPMSMSQQQQQSSSSSLSLRRTRQNIEENEYNSVEAPRLRTNRRILHHDTDHSYHMTVHNRNSSRRILPTIEESESDHDNTTQRQSRTRSRRRLQSDRADSDGNDDDNEELQQKSKKPPPRLLQQQQKKTSESEHSQQEDMLVASTSTRRNLNPVRQVRTNRNSRVLPEEEEEEETEDNNNDDDDDDDDDDNEPLANHLSTNSTQLQRNRPVRTTINEYRPHNGRSLTRINREQNTITGNHQQVNNNTYVISRRAAATQSSSAGTLITRSHANNNSINNGSSSSTIGVINSDAVPSSSTAAATTTTQLRGHVFRSHVQVDHNYGEPGPSTLRNTRRMLSRHQRNADELDPPNNGSNNHDNSVQLPAVVENISSRLRMRQTVNSTTVTRNGIEIPERQIRQASLRSNTNSSSNNHHHRHHHRLIEEVDNDEHEEIDSNDSDTDDNAPLTSFVRHLKSTSTTSALRNRNDDVQRTETTTTTTNNPTINSAGRTLRPRRFTSDEDYEGDGDIDDFLVYERVSRSTRNLKRPHYNEDSDDDSFDGCGGGNSINRKRRAIDSSSNHIRLSSSPNYRQRINNNVPSTSTRNLDHDGIMDSDNERNIEQTVSISSRGRIRKITAKARGLFRD